MLRRFKNWLKKSHFIKRECVLDKREETFFFELKKQLRPDFYIFPKMRVADIVQETNGTGYYFLRNKVLPRHIDFLICDGGFHPVLAIELNGTSHLRVKSRRSDELKRKIFAEVGLPLETVGVGSDFSQDIKNLIEKYSLIS